jgi:hypothetical protein
MRERDQRDIPHPVKNLPPDFVYSHAFYSIQTSQSNITLVTRLY